MHQTSAIPTFLRVGLLLFGAITWGVSAQGCDETDNAPSIEEEALEEPVPVAQVESDPPNLRVLPELRVLAIDIECRPGVVFFETDSAELMPDAVTNLNAMAICLKGTAEGEDVTVRGRTDPRGSEDYNEELAQARAEAVVSHFQSQGVSEGTFEIVAVGEDGATEGLPRVWPTQRNATVRPE